ncbi:ABC transporter ATP-binding protein [Naumannella halotolerans]|uniref:ABC-type quaternary amine transporter n=1 Tax=Naumannella halotolerans TaxID=993414 RepID=A0A4R7J5F9_9ACTN|nr:ABC transporter ATP-binding protein [Naumannella halotolerans]TDT32580.1 osmoprotectant transport system ATP-binding protein [Naumannella halotolerans]
MIEFDGVSKQYPGGTTAVSDLDLTIPSGKITVFVGPSGCGKTTSLRMINRMVDPTTGTVSIDGDDVARRPAAQLRRTIGYVIQSGGLFPHRTVVDNVATVPVLDGVGKRQARDRARELLEVVGLDASLGDRYPVQLSGGQQQRVGVARALAADPPIMLMDEPFSAVDPVVREDLQNELLRLQAELGKTIVMVTHDIDEAIKLGDLVAVFASGGKLAQFSPPAELLADPADDFVAGLVGRDRGYRGLSFLSADDLELQSIDSSVDGAKLITDAGRPVGWQDGAGLNPDVGTYTEGATLRTVVDQILLSAVGAAVRVDGDGRAVGLALQSEVIAQAQEREPRDRIPGEPVAPENGV